MPVSRRSRYARTPAIAVPGAGPGSAAVTALAQRQIPAAPGREDVYRHLLSAEESIEYLAWRYYGRSEDWWRIADANPLTYPLQIRPGAAVSIPLTDDAGRVERTRQF